MSDSESKSRANTASCQRRRGEVRRPAASPRNGERRSDRPGTTGKPLLSVIVPVYNSIADLKHCLDALAASDHESFEVIVVDDGSTEPMAEVVARYGFRYVRLEGPGGPARARNRGVAQALGGIVVFIDADVCVHSDTLRHMAERFTADPSIDAVIGTYDDAPAHPGFLSQYKNIFHHYVHRDSHGEISTFWSGCGAIRRDLFEAFGGFDEVRYARPSIEDIELGTWISAAGHRIVLDSRVQCQHRKRWTFGNLLKTDVVDRGIPWTRLMLRAGHVPNTLNVKLTQRLSVLLVFVTLGFLGVGVWWPWAWAAAGATMVGVTLLNVDFYRYFSARRGFWFALRVIPLHWLYYFYCGLSALAGTWLHYWRREPGSADPLSRIA